MAINPLCCYGLQRNATNLKPQASQTQPEHLKVKQQGKKKKKKINMEAKSRRKPFCILVEGVWFNTEGCLCLLSFDLF